MDKLNEKILDAYKTSILERKFDLGSGTMGNGVVIWNRAKEVHGDYEKVAHIDPNRKVKYYIKSPPKQVKDYVEKIAKGKNFAASSTQPDMKVFKEGIGDFVDDSELKENILKDIRIDVNKIVMNDIIPRIKKSEDAIKKKYKLNKDANMYVKNYGTAFLHDIFRELIGQSLVSSGNLKKRF